MGRGCARSKASAKADGGSVQNEPPVIDEAEPAEMPRRRTINVFGRKIGIPASRAARISLGVTLVLCGTLGFLPVLGFWMIPLGLLVLSHDHSGIRRLRRRGAVRWGKRWRRNP
jgi:hypothetical protein